LALACLLTQAVAWDNAELDLFDLVEEVQSLHQQTLYEFLGLDNSCTSADVRRSYKKLALQLHPDKNDAEDAEVQFRRLAAVYEVLKDKELRERYDQVLVEGLPNWKSTAFYFRRMRKIGLLEGLLYLMLIATGIQYCMNWAAYLERRFTISENVTSEVRRKRKLKKTGKNEEELVEELVEEHMKGVGPPPTAFDTLPFQLGRAVKWTALALPGVPVMLMEAWREEQRKKEMKMKQQEEWEEEKRAREEEKVKKKEAKAKRKTVYKEAVEGEDNVGVKEVKSTTEKVLPRNANQMWTDEDLIELARLIKKIPGGRLERWERIAEAMERTAEEVTKMAGKIKNNPSIVPKKQGMTGREEKRLIADDCLETEIAGEDEDDDCEDDEESQTEEEEVDEDGYVVYGAVKAAEEYVIPEEKSKKKTKGGKLGEAPEGEETVWSQEQQRSLEVALSQFPKGSAERWDRIAGKVEGKSKEQCMARFKQLAEQVKKKKAEAAE